MNFRRLSIAILLIMALPGWAAPKKKKESTTSSKTKPVSAEAAEALVPAGMSAWLRLWKADFESKRSVRISIDYAAKGRASTDLGTWESVSIFGEYISVPWDGGTIKVFDLSDSKTPLATAPARFTPGLCVTLLVREKADVVSIEVLEDTPKGETTCELLVRNFVPTLKSFQLDAGPAIHVRLESPDSFLHLRGLPRASLQIDTASDDKKSGTIKWSNEIDFGNIRRATLLILTDAYGRIRPRLVIDGVPPRKPAPESAPAPGGER